MLNKILHRFSRLSASNASKLALHIGSTELSLVKMHQAKIVHYASRSYGAATLLSELNGLLNTVGAASKLHIVLAAEFYQLVQLDKPALAENELLQALPWQIKDLVNLAPEDMVLDYIDLPAVTAQTKINVVAASFSWLKLLVQQAEQAGITLVSIEPEEWLASRMIAPTSQATMLVIHQPEQEVLIQIIRDGELYFSRRTRGFSNLHLSVASELTDGMLDRLQLELQRSMDYFESQLKQAPVRNIRLLMTESAKMCKLFAQSGFSRVEPLELPAVAASLSAKQQLELWPAVAALIPHNTEQVR